MRYLATVLGLLLVLGVLGGIKAAQIGTLVSFGKKAAQAGPPPEAVGSAVATEDTWERTITDVGSIAARKGVTVSNEIAGVVTRIHFESGQTTRQGATLVELDTSVERSQLAAALARKELAQTTMQRTRALAATGSIAPAQVDADRASQETADKDVDTLRAQIAKKSIRAPFDGRLGIRGVNVGQYLAPGTAITILETTKALFVDFTSPQEDLPLLSSGTPVRLAIASGATGEGIERTGSIDAIEPAVDPMTRAAKVRASIPNEDEALRPGMFVRITVVLPQKEHVVIVPSTAIVHASYGDSVFVIEDKPPGAPGMRTTPDGKPVKVARQQLVKLGTTRGDFVAVTAGITPGQRVVSAGAFKLRTGAPVVVNDAIQPKPELAPRPPNR